MSVSIQLISPTRGDEELELGRIIATTSFHSTDFPYERGQDKAIPLQTNIDKSFHSTDFPYERGPRLGDIPEALADLVSIQLISPTRGDPSIRTLSPITCLAPNREASLKKQSPISKRRSPRCSKPRPSKAARDRSKPRPLEPLATPLATRIAQTLALSCVHTIIARSLAVASRKGNRPFVS